MHQSTETPAHRPPGYSGGLTRLSPTGFNALLTARWPRGVVDLTKCLLTGAVRSHYEIFFQSVKK